MINVSLNTDNTYPEMFNTIIIGKICNTVSMYKSRLTIADLATLRRLIKFETTDTLFSINKEELLTDDYGEIHKVIHCMFKKGDVIISYIIDINDTETLNVIQDIISTEFHRKDKVPVTQ